jgi:hypothetical protein
LSHTSIFFALVILQLGSLNLFAQAGFKLWSSWSQPPKELGLQAWATSAQFTVSFWGYENVLKLTVATLFVQSSTSTQRS